MTSSLASGASSDFTSWESSVQAVSLRAPHTYCDPLGHVMLAENVTLDHTRLGDLADVCHSWGDDCVAIIRPAILGQESDQVLPNSKLPKHQLKISPAPTENSGMIKIRDQCVGDNNACISVF